MILYYIDVPNICIKSWAV